MSAGQPLGGFQFGVPGPFAKVMVWVAADMAATLILGKICNVDVRTGQYEGR